MSISIESCEKKKADLVSAIHNLEQDIIKFNHKIFGRSKALEEAAIKQEEIDQYKESLVAIKREIDEKETEKANQEELLEQLKKKRHYLYIDRKVLFKKWGIKSI